MLSASCQARLVCISHTFLYQSNLKSTQDWLYQLLQMLHVPFSAVMYHESKLTCCRSCQEDVIESVLRGEDNLVVMATGAGKSICYQVT